MIIGQVRHIGKLGEFSEVIIRFFLTFTTKTFILSRLVSLSERESIVNNDFVSTAQKVENSIGYSKWNIIADHRLQ